MKPAPNGLALLRTCRRAKLEIGNSWLRHVLFNFEGAAAMLDKLTILPVDTLSEIRNVRVSSGDLDLWLSRGNLVHYHLDSVLKLLPGLRLDQLTVLGGIGSMDNYETLNRLVKDSNGWKTLRYICHSSEVLGYPSSHGLIWESSPDRWRKTQPKQWQAIMEARDGAASNPSVTVYRAKKPAFYGRILDPRKRVKFEQKPRRDEDTRPSVFRADPRLMDGDQPKKELMVVVKRGSGIDWEEKKDSPFIERDIRRDFPGMAWTRIRGALFRSLEDEEEDEGRSHPYDEVRSVVDVYKDVDEYVWTPDHLGIL